MARTLMAAVAAIISHLIARYALPINNGLMASQQGLVSRLSRARPLVERHGTGNASRI